jgi:hypothetical protein
MSSATFSLASRHQNQYEYEAMAKPVFEMFLINSQSKVVFRF